MNHSASIKTVSQKANVKYEASDDILAQLLRKLDKGTETIMNLRALITTKTAELDQLIQQLRLIDQVLTHVEHGTEQIEQVLKDLTSRDELVYAEATLNSALQSACLLSSSIPTCAKKPNSIHQNNEWILMNKVNTKLKQLDIDPTHYFSTLDDTQVLQKALIDLEIAKTISTCIKNDYKRRSALMKNKHAEENIMQLGDKIREEVKVWKKYSRNAPLMIQGKDILVLLHIQDQQVTKNKRKSNQALYSKHTSSSMAKLHTTRPSSVLKLRKLLGKRSSQWLTMTKVPPWIPAGYNWTPSPLPPIIRSDETLFEKRLRKALPKLSIAVSPKSRYIGSKEIGTGVNGAVIQVHVKNNAAQKLALKKCKLSHDKEYRTAIIRELRIMSTGHNHIIKVREVSIYQNDIWIAMDLMRCSVFAVLCVRALPEEYAILVAKETLKALEFLHCKGFIHRDIKCENLLISQNGEIKLADFGLATTKKHLNRERLGTAKWMSPEVIREEFYDEKVDLWSLGITIIEMMDRIPPHYNIKSDEKVFQKILKEPSPTFSFSYPTIYCTGLVAWLLEEDPINRPSATEVIRVQK
ncbi:signal transducing kinase of the PAK [Rhizopus azygosporus]|uniref:non-specific serine/threonine protein kinase n=1 Tax=Rhizopus azygosporus TaxID=86630 RepID=A0A367J8D7_RHIAZ|nr:signal transducing kinase of the PAK [Rhizopus azygosporus]